jgi:hypothetical protein
MFLGVLALVVDLMEDTEQIIKEVAEEGLVV